MCTGTANTNVILRHTTTPPIPSTSKENFSGYHLWTTMFDTNIQYALHFSYLEGIARERDGEAPITNRRSVDMHCLKKRKQWRALPLFPLGLCWDNAHLSSYQKCKINSTKQFCH